MILNQYGRPVTSSHRGWQNGRHGEQMDGFQMANGAVVSERASMDLHRRIENDSVLRERIETAQKMTGKETLHRRTLTKLLKQTSGRGKRFCTSGRSPKN